ncbi:MAG: tRNA uridine(34) 5-carboxymethylaminomethyl modification radical SAM/GNAT enzyme Elp3 [Candidatus Micrarchaeota archaeon]|nr:tRNA uridine(34) 5-carboxymethylaminomethyl modification radical SAM/GNAT enzyme Elp3 [Candidatus Micrarchaeota archaeon]
MASASRAQEAAKIQGLLGRLPKYAPPSQRKQSESMKKAAAEAALLLLEGKADIQSAKHIVSEKYKIPFIRNSDILAHIPKERVDLKAKLLKSPTRTLSGVSPIAIMPPPAPCGGACIYCPKGEGAPQSYTGFEPTTMRAIQNSYSARNQIIARINQYLAQGHPVDKCHLIIMGGTFLYGFSQNERHAFMKEAFDTLNQKASKDLKQAIDQNEFAPYRAVGVTFETRPDYGFQPHAEEMLQMGGTQVELGVQVLSDRIYKKVNRGHKVKDVILSTQILKDSGFKVCYHMMPGLLSTPNQDISYFKRLFSSQDFQPDMLKIYPALVIVGTGLYKLWKEGKYSPYDTQTAADVIAKATRFIPPYVRIMRVQRDIPSPLVQAGVKHSNLRQIVDEKLAQMGQKCRCIRCREVGSALRKGQAPKKLSLQLERIDYAASNGKEIFLSFEDKKEDALAAFLRLRIPYKPHRPELQDASVVRQLHVYGHEVAIGAHEESKLQHQGLGARLLLEAQEITKKEFGLSKICVISGPGARGYYRKRGYFLEGAYMAKKL